ncbi:hypothetical protein L6164_027404 [Bauhinia variegata]|uniref:Uncharacterized protein n=1 Tax=Bauhinia variegata TaxID=167791 RepID=A0ACB9LT84_BAUVA|nr:hypothetical protein L6164_027404 [Bauhinia variegata]
MGRPPCCDENDTVKKGPWTPEEDQKLMDYIGKHGHGNWRTLPKLAGLNRCGKSCRLRWTNYLRSDIKRGKFTEEEERMIINLHSDLGNKWSKIAAHLPGRTDNEIKNFWNTHIRKKLLQMGIDPETHKPRTDYNHLLNLSQLLGMSASLGNLMSPWRNPLGLQADVTHLAKLQQLQNLLQILNNNSVVNMNNLLGNKTLGFNPFEAFLNKSSTTIQDPSLFPQAQSNFSQDISKSSWTDIAGGFNAEALGFNNSSITSHETQKENTLPALVSSSTGTSIFNQKDTCNTAQMSFQSPSPPIFDAWEKLLDDEESGSIWKEILEYVLSNSSLF